MLAKLQLGPRRAKKRTNGAPGTAMLPVLPLHRKPGRGTKGSVEDGLAFKSSIQTGKPPRVQGVLTLTNGADIKGSDGFLLGIAAY